MRGSSAGFAIIESHSARLAPERLLMLWYRCGRMGVLDHFLLVPVLALLSLSLGLVLGRIDDEGIVRRKGYVILW
jgi:hypothetical protein